MAPQNKVQASLSNSIPSNSIPGGIGTVGRLFLFSPIIFQSTVQEENAVYRIAPEPSRYDTRGRRRLLLRMARRGLSIWLASQRDPQQVWQGCKLPKAKKFFATLNRQNLFSIYYRLHSAKKSETRAKRMAQILSMLEKETKLR